MMAPRNRDPYPYSFFQDRFLVGCLTLIILVIIAGTIFLEYAGRGSDVRAAAIAVVPAITSVITLLGLGTRAAQNRQHLVEAKEALDKKPSTGEIQRVINGKIQAALQEAFRQGQAEGDADAR